MAENPTKKELLLDATMKIVAENGLLSFSMRQVTKEVGTSETLIYRHFGTKENLLFQCFQTVDREIAALFAHEQVPELASREDVVQYIHGLWMRYFSFLIQNGYKTLYYFEYRDSPYIATVVKHGDQAAKTYFSGFAEAFHVLNQNYRVLEKVDSDHLWTYILDVTGVFARRIIRGELPQDAASRESAWRLIFQGLAGLL